MPCRPAATDLAMLRGARLVTASETEEGRAWAEARIKQMTGGDRIRARFMRQDYFEYLVYAGRVPGRVVGLSRTGGWVDVLSGDGALRIFDVIQPSSGSTVPAATLISSTRITLGLSRLNLLRRIMALEERLAMLSSGAAGSEDGIDRG
jgi:hypothetical protein